MPVGKHRARVLAFKSVAEAEREVARLGIRPPALQWLAHKMSLRAVRLEQVRGKSAALLKQECLAVGCDCAIAPQVAAFDDTPRAVIIIAHLRQYQRLLARLPGQALGLGELAEEIRQALAAYEAARRPRWICRGVRLPTDRRTLVMGIINVTPDSFSGDGLAGRAEAAVRQGLAFVEAGADLLDVGGESTRPGSEPVPVEEELHRIEPVIRELAAATSVPISVDTQKPAVARRALELGAAIVNDVNALRAPGMAELVAETGAGVILMHMRGVPKTMQVDPYYEDLMTEIYDYLAARLEAALQAGVAEEAIAVDPGFGFGKTVQHNLELLRRLEELHSLGRPVVIGTSRKSTLGVVLDKPVQERLLGTAASCAVAICCGAHVIRVHDVAEMVQVARMTDAILQGWEPDDSA
jgi:dihydropteroate synthase